jgi:hypothetical protein
MSSSTKTAASCGSNKRPQPSIRNFGLDIIFVHTKRNYIHLNKSLVETDRGRYQLLSIPL